MPFLGMSTNIILVIIGIGLLIFIHELGHFIVAKKIGVRVFVFSLGFGPPIFMKKIGETEYKLSLFPLGGYVKLAGEQTGKECKGEEWEFMSKKPGQRAAVLAAGVVFNTFLAFIAFIIAFRIGVPFVTAEIGQTIPGWPAWEADIKPGDKIIKVNKIQNPDFEDIFISVALNNSPEGINLEIEREGKTFDVNVIPRYDAAFGIQRIGIAPAKSLEVNKLFALEGTDSPAQKADLRIGDRIIAVNGAKITTENEFREIEKANPGKELILTVSREGKMIELEITPSIVSRWMIGLSCATTEIIGIKMDSLAYSSGIKKGDKIVKVNSKDVKGFSQLINAITNSPIGKITLEILRGNTTKIIELTKSDEETVKKFFDGISYHYGLTVDSTVEGFPAEKVGIKPGDHITAIDGKDISEWNHLLQFVTNSHGKELEFTWIRGNERFVKKIRPKKDKQNAQGQIGVMFGEKKIVRKYGLIGACKIGTYKTIVNVKRIYLTIRGFFTKKLSTKALGGPVLIAQASYESAKSGIGKLLYFMAIISINLAVLNILPVPVLDGGHLLFLGIEKIKGSPLSERTLAIANYIGLALILSLLIYATKNDIMRILNIL
ncbi:MAG: RIP metalloprotease RseP [Candidatus Scalinduaceae bacterium]